MIEVYDETVRWCTVTELVSNYDGDSCWLEVALPFRVKAVVNIRLARLNAPELKADGGKEAKVFFAERILTALAQGKKVRLKSYKTEKFGRWLGDFYINHDGQWEDLNQTMLDLGYAAPYDGKTKAE